MKYRFLIPAIAVCLSCSLGSARADHEKDSKSTTTVNSQSALNVSQVLHSRVVDRQGQKIGDVEDIVLDQNNGRIQFAVLKLSGDLADRGRYTPVPFSLLKVSDSDKKDMFGHRDLILQTDREKLLSASRFNAKNWPDREHATWGSDVYSHYGVTWDGDLQRGATGATFDSTAGTDRSVTVEQRDYPTTYRYESRTDRYSDKPIDNGTGPDGKDTFRLTPRPWPYHDVTDAH